MEELIQQLSAELNCPASYVQNVVTLIDEGNTIPFIARYRKEMTGSLDDQLLRELYERLLYLRNLDEMREAVEVIPMNRIVLETDSPYLAPEPNRGKRNCSLNIPYVIQALSQIKGLPPEEIEQLTWDNACRMYGMR